MLADPSGELTALHDPTQHYPGALAEALVQGLWEASFLLAGARTPAARGDTAFVAGCLFRVVGLCAHALHGRAGRWLLNEKGAVAATARLPVAPTGFAARVQRLLGQVGSDAATLTATLDAAAALVADTTTACRA